jgi:hypothetical protein
MTFTRKGMGRVLQIFSPPIVKQVLMNPEVSGNFNCRTASSVTTIFELWLLYNHFTFSFRLNFVISGGR